MKRSSNRTLQATQGTGRFSTTFQLCHFRGAPERWRSTGGSVLQCASLPKVSVLGGKLRTSAQRSSRRSSGLLIIASLRGIASSRTNMTCDVSTRSRSLQDFGKTLSRNVQPRVAALPAKLRTPVQRSSRCSSWLLVVTTVRGVALPQTNIACGDSTKSRSLSGLKNRQIGIGC